MQQQKAKVTRPQKVAPRTSLKTKRAPRQAHREATRTRETRDPNAPAFIPCSLKGPDGQERPGWEMWVGDMLFGRADTKESLLQYYTRLHEPIPSGHWKDRAWQSSPRAARRQRTTQYDEAYEDDMLLDSEQAGVWD